MISSGGVALGAFTFDLKNPTGEKTISVPLSLVRDGVVPLDLSFPDAVSPISLKLSGDTRRLAMYLGSVRRDR